MSRLIDTCKVPMSLAHTCFTGPGYRTLVQALTFFTSIMKNWGHDTSRVLLLAVVKTIVNSLPDDLRLAKGLRGASLVITQKPRLRRLHERNHELTLGDFLFALRTVLKELNKELATVDPEAPPNEVLQTLFDNATGAIGN